MIQPVWDTLASGSLSTFADNSSINTAALHVSGDGLLCLDMNGASRHRLAGPSRRRRKLGASLVGAGILVASVAIAAQRGQVAPEEGFRNPYAWPSLRELVERADTIVAGEVLDLRSAWTADRGEIFTTVTLRPDRRFKGGERSLIRFRIPGGTVGDVRLMVTHSPVFAVGEHTLVFLAGESGRLPEVVAGEAGKRHIRISDDSEETILPGFAVSEPGTGRTAGLDTLDDLAAAMPRLAASASR